MFSRELKKLRKAKNLTQADLAKRLNVAPSTIAMYETERREPSYTMLLQIADYFNVNLQTLSKGSNDPCLIPVLGKIQAGIPLEAIEDIIDYEEIPNEMAKQGEYFGLQIKGDSMSPRFQEGDVVIVRKQASIDNDDIAIMLVNGNDATIKKIKKDKNGIALIPLNPNYQIKYYSNAEIIDLPVTCIGKVVELRGKF